MRHLRIEFATSFTWLFRLCFAMRGCSTRLQNWRWLGWLQLAGIGWIGDCPGMVRALGGIAICLGGIAVAQRIRSGWAQRIRSG